jgi:hypothetical protein
MQDADIEKTLREALERMQERAPESQLVIFTEPQAQALTEVATWWIALRGAGKIGAAMGSALRWLALFIGAWIAFKAGLLEWITSNLGAGK